ncbi:hypothetical protein V8C86DRAFT_454808 [Haematococcus lacustris]
MVQGSKNAFNLLMEGARIRSTGNKRKRPAEAGPTEGSAGGMGQAGRMGGPHGQGGRGHMAIHINPARHAQPCSPPSQQVQDDPFGWVQQQQQQQENAMLVGGEQQEHAVLDVIEQQQQQQQALCEEQQQSQELGPPEYLKGTCKVVAVGSRSCSLPFGTGVGAHSPATCCTCPSTPWHSSGNDIEQAAGRWAISGLGGSPGHEREGGPGPGLRPGPGPGAGPGAEALAKLSEQPCNSPAAPSRPSSAAGTPPAAAMAALEQGCWRICPALARQEKGGAAAGPLPSLPTPPRTCLPPCSQWGSPATPPSEAIAQQPPRQPAHVLATPFAWRSGEGPCAGPQPWPLATTPTTPSPPHATTYTAHTPATATASGTADIAVGATAAISDQGSRACGGVLAAGAASSRCSPAGPAGADSFLLVLDLEASCRRGGCMAPMEVIELAAVVVDCCSLTQVGEFQSFVRPTAHPLLDPFCTQLTNIQQHQVDRAPGLEQVLCRLTQWLTEPPPAGLGLLGPGGVGTAALLPVTWSAWDLQICLEMECRWRNILTPAYLRRWCDLRKVFASKLKPAGNLKASVEAVGLTWQGRAHSGLDDARNTANLALYLMRERGVAIRQSGAFGDAPAVAGQLRLRQSSLSSFVVSSDKQAKGAARWGGQCHCGVPAALRVTKKPGVNNGRSFYSCGGVSSAQRSGAATATSSSGRKPRARARALPWLHLTMMLCSGQGQS